VQLSVQDVSRPGIQSLPCPSRLQRAGDQEPRVRGARREGRGRRDARVEDGRGQPLTERGRVTSSDRLATLPPDGTAFSSGTTPRSFSVTLHTAGSQTVSVGDQADNLLGTAGGLSGQATVTVTAAAAAATLHVATADSANIGQERKVTVIASDAAGFPVPGFTGTVTLGSSATTDKWSSLSTNHGTFTASAGTYAFKATDKGVATFSVTLGAVGSDSITATDAGLTADGATVAVTPGQVTQLSVAAAKVSTKGSAVTGVTVKAENTYGGQVDNYTGTVHFTSTDKWAELPSDYPFTCDHSCTSAASGLDDGSKSFSGASASAVTLNTKGTAETIIVTDITNPTITGSTKVTVQGAAPVNTVRRFAPYVELRHADTSPVAFDTAAGNPAGSVILTFIMSEGTGNDACTPVWDNGETLTQAAADANVDGPIAAAQKAGEQVEVSFSGQLHPELAVSCIDPTSLQAAYQAVVTHYNLSAIAFDIEAANNSLDPTVNARRANAIYAVQQAQAKLGKPLAVWLTLAAASTGLPTDRQDVITAMLNAHVAIAGVNVMTEGFEAVVGQTMSSVAETALTDAAEQIETIDKAAGIELGAYGAWPEMGATIKEGVVDVTVGSAYAGQTWGLADATAMRSFAVQNHLGLLSMFDLQRDQPCTASNNSPSFCSGVTQTPLQFSHILLGK
jgi:hypothetical protein